MDVKVLVEYTISNLIDEEDLKNDFEGDLRKVIENTGDEVWALADDTGSIYGIRKISS
jgi:hypothetical protein